MNPYTFPGLKGVKILEQYLIIAQGITPERVVEVVCESLDITQKELKGKKRDRPIAYSRHIISHILVKKMGLQLTVVGKQHLGGRDHSTVINSLRTFSNLYDTDEPFRARYQFVIESLCIAGPKKEGDEPPTTTSSQPVTRRNR